MTARESLLQRAGGRGGPGRACRLIVAGSAPEPLARAAEGASRAGFADVLRVGPGATMPESHPRHRDVATLLRTRAPDRVRDAIHALDLASDPLRFGAGLLALDEGAALVAPGCVPLRELADVSEWLLEGAGNEALFPPTAAACLLPADGRLTLAADCGLPGRRGPQTLARVGQALAGLRGRLVEDASVVGFLAGPEHASPETEAPWRLAREAFTALAPAVSQADEASPAADGRFRARPNVLIFPDSTAGYLTVRALRAYGRVELAGLVILGASRPVLAISGDATDDELTAAAAVAALLAATPGH